MTGVVMSHRTTWVGAALVRLFGGAKPSGRVVVRGVDRLGP
jgi:hypothetical protein